jgi:hypothetical protein
MTKKIYQSFRLLYVAHSRRFQVGKGILETFGNAARRENVQLPPPCYHMIDVMTRASEKNSPTNNILIGKAYPENQPKREDLQASLHKYEAKIDPVDGPHCESYDETGREVWMHDVCCAVYKYPDIAECPQQELDYYSRRLRNLEGQWYMLQCFIDRH